MIGRVSGRFVDLCSVVIVLLGALFLGRALISNRAHSLAPAAIAEASVHMLFADYLEGGHWLGPRDAPVVVLVYGTYMCGYCKELDESLVKLRARYPDHLATVHKHWVEPVRGEELTLALGAECAAAAGAFEAYHTAAFEHPDLLGVRNGWRRIGEMVRLRQPEFNECVLSQQYVDAVGTQYLEGTALGVTATPTSFVNGMRVVGAAPLVALDSLIASAMRSR